MDNGIWSRANWRKQATVIIAVLGILVLLVALGWSAWYIYNDQPDVGPSSQIEPMDTRASATSAEDRADAAITRIIVEHEPSHASLVKPISNNKKETPSAVVANSLPETTLNMNCVRLKKAYSSEELKSMKEYQEICE